MEVFEQFKAEVDGAELTAPQKYMLQLKYGLATPTEEEVETDLLFIRFINSFDLSVRPQ